MATTKKADKPRPSDPATPPVEMGEPTLNVGTSAPDLTPGDTPKPKRQVSRARKVDESDLSEREKRIQKFSDFPQDKLPLNASAGQIEGAVRMHNGLPVAFLNLKGWIGDPPIAVLADELSDIEEVIASLRKQAEEALK